MTEKWPEVFRSLRRAKVSSERRLAEIENERREIKASMKSLDAAIKALGKAVDETESKRAVTTAEVTEIVIQILRTRSKVSDNQLIQLVGDQVSSDGRSCSGLKLRLTQALKDGRFMQTADGYELAGAGDRSTPDTKLHGG